MTVLVCGAVARGVPQLVCSVSVGFDDVLSTSPHAACFMLVGCGEVKIDINHMSYVKDVESMRNVFISLHSIQDAIYNKATNEKES